jgi:hypothetical protein
LSLRSSKVFLESSYDTLRLVHFQTQSLKLTSFGSKSVLALL